MGIQTAKISDLTQGNDIQTGDLLEIERSGASYKANADTILTRLTNAENAITTLNGQVFLKIKGDWNALNNTPNLLTITKQHGDAYKVSVSGSTNLDGITDWQVSDIAVYGMDNKWFKIDNTQFSEINDSVVALNTTYSSDKINTLLNLKQNITDNTLNTTSKTIVGAINELQTGKNVKSWFISGGVNGSGNDANNGYKMDNAFATLLKLNTVLGNTGEQVIFLPSQLTESATFSQLNVEFVGFSASHRAVCGTTGTITSNNSGSGSQTYAFLTLGSFSKTGVGYVILYDITINTSYSDSSNSTTDSWNCQFGTLTPISITGSGIKNFYNQRGGVFSINNASTQVNVATNDYIAQFTLTAGLLSIRNAIVYVAQGTTFTIGANGATFIAEGVRFMYPDNTPAKINIPIGVNYSLQGGCVYDIQNSTLNGTNVASLYKGYFDNIVTNTVNLKSSTSSTLLATDSNKNIQSLSTSTYPSLTELAYVKGATSSLQTQINGLVVQSNNGSDFTNKQTTLNNITQVSGATNEYVLTKDTNTGNALWKASQGGGGTSYALTGVSTITSGTSSTVQIGTFTTIYGSSITMDKVQFEIYSDINLTTLVYSTGDITNQFIGLAGAIPGGTYYARARYKISFPSNYSASITTPYMPWTEKQQIIVPAGTPVQLCLTTSLSAYNAAANGNWVGITDVEYAALATNLSNINVIGTSNADIRNSPIGSFGGSAYTYRHDNNGSNDFGYLLAFKIASNSNYIGNVADKVKIATSTNLYDTMIQVGSSLPANTISNLLQHWILKIPTQSFTTAYLAHTNTTGNLSFAYQAATQTGAYEAGDLLTMTSPRVFGGWGMQALGTKVIQW